MTWLIGLLVVVVLLAAGAVFIVNRRGRSGFSDGDPGPVPAYGNAGVAPYGKRDDGSGGTI
jgi:hypothetical protein